jgi:hypothetical protein
MIEQMIVLDDSMDALARFGPRKAKVVELRFFGGLRRAANRPGAEDLRSSGPAPREVAAHPAGL